MMRVIPWNLMTRVKYTGHTDEERDYHVTLTCSRCSSSERFVFEPTNICTACVLATMPGTCMFTIAALEQEAMRHKERADRVQGKH